jgi:hypothetical protein
VASAIVQGWLAAGNSSILAVADLNAAADRLLAESHKAGLESQTFRFGPDYSTPPPKGTRVVVTTCVGSASKKFNALRFERVLIDEATQCTEPASLVPLCRGARRLVLVGDHKQLPPTVMSGAQRSTARTHTHTHTRTHTHTHTHTYTLTLIAH